MDDLNYTYYGNKLTNVDDAGNVNFGFKDRSSAIEYTYDSNGNMLTDYNKGITNINYNFLNLPTEVTIDNGTNIGDIQYIYDAIGKKQRKIVSAGTITDYADNYIYENDIL